jgi:hypothetical protein
MLRMEGSEMEELQSLATFPCAGITLIRFYGYYLSLSVFLRISTPRNLRKLPAGEWPRPDNGAKIAFSFMIVCE